MPDVSAVHIDRALSNVSIKYQNNAFVADVIAPPVEVAKESDKYFIYGRENFRIPYAKRADKAETREITYSLSADSYFAEEYGYHELISDRERSNADDPLRPDIDATEHLTDCLMLDREYRVANTILDSTNPSWGTYAATHFQNLLNAWDNKAGADPRGDIYHAKFMIFHDSRKAPNRIFIPVEVGYQLAQIEQVDELRKYTDPGLLRNSGLPPVLWGLAVSECESSYDAAVDGATADYNETWGNNVVVAYVHPASIGLKTVTFALRFRARNFETRKWREEKRRSDVVEVTEIYDAKIVAPACGFVFTNVITSVA